MSTSRLLNPSVFLELLETYCRISSATSDEPGLRAAQTFLAELLHEIGFTTQWIAPASSEVLSSAPLLLGRRWLSDNAPTVVFVSHTDTLDGAGFHESRFAYDSEKKHLIGQGVLDDKASQFVALRGIAQALSEGTARQNFIFLASPSEEIGSPGFHEFYRQLSHEADLVLGFEPALEGQHLITRRRGNRWYSVAIEGREAHSGRAHRFGVNAAHELAYLVTGLDQLTSYEQDVTVNIGEITTSSHLHNVVCGKAEAKIDTRFSSLSDRDRLHHSILKLFDQRHLRSEVDGKTCEIRWKIDDDCPPLEESPSSGRWGACYAQEVSAIENRPIETRSSGGGADVSHFYRPELTIIDGLGACGANMHRSDESVVIDSLWSRSLALSRFLRHFSKLVPPYMTPEQ
ncbi:MAG: hypothetical protein RJB38_1112 [Pseudomonadota bacterium]|jgi:glutamate carboxypeptidase